MRTWALASLVLVGGSGACARPGQGARVAPSVVDAVLAADEVPLRVRNNTPAAMKVLVVDHGAWRFIGFVEAGMTADFSVPGLQQDGAPMRILALPTNGGAAARTGPLTVAPGQTVTFTIESDPARSSATVH